MIGIDSYTDLASHSAAVEEVHELAALLARIVTEVRDDSGLMSPTLVRLVEGGARRPSVARRLREAVS